MVQRQRDRGLESDAPRSGTAPSCRLHVVLAEDSRKAVIFRRGPSRSTRLIAWDRATDTFEPGQWMRRASVYPERASLSPDGEYLLSFIGTFRGRFETYSVLSRPPYFTALALWPKGDTWGGGGTFVGPREFVLEHDDLEPRLSPGFRWPGDFVLHGAGPAGKARLEHWQRRQTCWRPRVLDKDSRSFVKRGHAGAALVTTWRLLPGSRRRVDHAVETPSGAAPLPGAQWLDFDANGDVLFSAGGALHRLRCAILAEATARADAMRYARRLADFSEMRFEPIQAPYARGAVVARSPHGEHFAPRLDRVGKEDRRRRRADRKALRAVRGDN